jgi:hypothetical protein
MAISSYFINGYSTGEYWWLLYYRPLVVFFVIIGYITTIGGYLGYFYLRSLYYIFNYFKFINL